MEVGGTVLITKHVDTGTKKSLGRQHHRVKWSDKFNRLAVMFLVFDLKQDMKLAGQKKKTKNRVININQNQKVFQNST